MKIKYLFEVEKFRSINTILGGGEYMYCVIQEIKTKKEIELYSKGIEVY